MNTQAYPEVVPTEPGFYICVPRVTIHNIVCEESFNPELKTDPVECNLTDGIWIVEVFLYKKDDYSALCYKHPTREEDFCIEGCSNIFYGPINGKE